LRVGTADLHIHSACSDGQRTPSEIARLARDAGLAWFSLTDHDTMAGNAEADAAAREVGIGFVPGLELSTLAGDQDLHILAYWPEAEDLPLRLLLERIAAGRIARANEIVQKLRAMGIGIEPGQIHGLDPRTGAVGRPHIARVLLAGGWVGSFGEAFARYIGNGAPAFVPKERIDPRLAIGVLRGARGVVVLAHPGAYRLDGLLDELIDAGLQGLEAYYPKCPASERAELVRLAAEKGLAISGGSDYHGDAISDGEIGGVRVDARLLDELAARKEQMQ